MADENKPLKNEDANQDKMVDVVLDKPADPVTTTTQQEEQKQQAVAPSAAATEKDWAKEAGVACNKAYNWFPITIFAWMSGWLLIACAIADMIALYTSFIAFWLYVYVILMSILILLIDMPYFLAAKVPFVGKMQLVLNDWMKLLSRTWGRCVLYSLVLISVASFIAMDDGETADKFRSLPWVAGIYLFIILILSLIFSKLAAIKYISLRQYIIKSTILPNVNDAIDDIDDKKDDKNDPNIDDQIEKQKFAAKYDELDVDKSGRIEMKEIRMLAKECGNTLSNSENQVIFVVLDEQCKGFVNKDQWIKSWLENKAPKML